MQLSCLSHYYCYYYSYGHDRGQGLLQFIYSYMMPARSIPLLPKRLTEEVSRVKFREQQSKDLYMGFCLSSKHSFLLVGHNTACMSGEILHEEIICTHNCC
ncbi:hypothetical protein ILYODFUR_013008 [Ilyodon furcidens]|uniref:Uncharacterized protein n=1 Tax=Ilyodon furcidens TaxID=33524 RepID=A0ABV0TVU5_9TELE